MVSEFRFDIAVFYFCPLLSRHAVTVSSTIKNTIRKSLCHKNNCKARRAADLCARSTVDCNSLVGGHTAYSQENQAQRFSWIDFILLLWRSSFQSMNACIKPRGRLVDIILKPKGTVPRQKSIPPTKAIFRNRPPMRKKTPKVISKAIMK